MLVSLEVPFFRAFSVRAVSTVRGWPLPQTLALSISTSVPARRRMPLLAAAVADEDEVLQYGVATGVAALLLPLLSHSIRQSQS